MIFDILTLFPAWFQGDSPVSDSILGRAVEHGLITLRVWNFRDYATDRHKVADDMPYGGGGGMLLKTEPICRALDAIAGPPGDPARPRVIYTSPQGARLDQRKVLELAALGRIVILCGRYEGVDERVIETRVDEEISIGDYVLTGGELPAMILTDAIARMIPGTLGNPGSAPRDSFYDGLLDCPHYTRPEVFEGRRVPEVLLSGHHARIEAWRRERALLKTARVRPDLLLARPDALAELGEILSERPGERAGVSAEILRRLGLESPETPSGQG